MTKNYGYGIGLKLLQQEGIEAIHNASLEILSEVGVKIAHKKAQEVLTGAGCTIDKEKDIVYFPKNVVIDAIDSLPKTTHVWYGRDPSKDFDSEKNKVRFGSSGTCPYINDLYTGERRLTTLADVELTAKIIDGIDSIPAYMLAVPACDIPPELMSLYQSVAILKNTSKNFVNTHETPWIFTQQLRMYELVAGGKEAFRQRPFAAVAVLPVSPLELLTDEVEAMFMGLEYDMPIDFFNDTMAGSTAPATLAGTLVVINAEILAGVTLAQNIKKGARCIYGTSSSIMDFKAMTTTIGAPEHAMISACAVQLSQYYNMTSITGGT